MSELSPERWRRIEELIDGALDRPAPDRDEFLRAACGGDATLYAEVRELLDAGERSEIPIDAPAAAFAADLLARTAPDASPRAMGTPDRVGPYRVVRELGQGGMGTVFLAEREAHFEQRVALKLIRRGLHLDTDLVRRFVEERQILASLDHPGIARLLDGGVTDEGLPWFAMELVEGEPVDRACDSRQLSIDARLELFGTIADAVEYAHGRSIVHRDLKPNNILVRADGTVKLLDFGIAKLLAPDRAAEETLTRSGVRLLTPEYASPEQIRGEPITPASDVYSLGVLLYQLVTGRRPYRVTGRSAHEIETAVLTQEPTRPSRVNDRLPGALDGIILRALAKAPEDRYPSARALAEDVRRHLQGLPVRVSARRRISRRVVAGVAGAVVLLVAAAAWLLSLRRDAPDPATAGGAPVIAVGLITDYRRAGATDLARPLADLLATNLARVPALRMVSTARLYELMAQLGTSGSTDAGAYSAAARRAGATMLVDGSLFTADDGALRLDLRRIDLGTGAVLAAETVSGRSIFAVVDSGTARVAAGIGASGPGGPVADVTTHSEVAYRFYEEGLRTFYRGDRRAARPLFETAVAEDSTFAMALYYLARSTTNPAASLRHLDRARRMASRASDRERLIIEASYRLLFADPAAIATADTLSVRYPHELDGHLIAGRALFEAADYPGALRRLRQGVVVDSLALLGARARCTLCDARAEIISAYLAMDSLDTVEREARAWTEVDPDRTAPWMTLGGFLLWRGQPEAAHEAYRRATAIDPTLQGRPAYYAYYVMRRGDYETADRALRDIIQTGSPDRRAEAYWFLAISLREQGRFAEALEATRSHQALQIRLNPDVPRAQFFLAEAQSLFELGRHRASVALFDSVSRAYGGWPPSFQARYRTWALGLGANPLAAAGDTALLAARVDSARVSGAQSLLGRDQRMHHYMRGLLLVARGEDESAITELRRAMTSPGYGYTRINVELARALMRVGRPREAAAVLAPAAREFEATSLYVTRTEVRELLARAWDAAGVRDSAAVHYRAVASAWRRADPALRERVDAVRRRLAELD